MAFIKETKLTVDSVIQSLDDFGAPDAEPEKITSEHTACIKESDNTTEISYSESTEGGACKTEITVKDGEVIIKRTGAVDTVMHFKEGERYSTLYSIPPYSFDAEIITRKVANNLKSSGTLEVKYIMTVGGAKRRTVLRISLWS